MRKHRVGGHIELTSNSCTSMYVAKTHIHFYDGNLVARNKQNENKMDNKTSISLLKSEILSWFSLSFILDSMQNVAFKI